MVKELLFHFALQERLHCLLEIRQVTLVDKEVKFMAVVVREVSVLLICTQSMPLFDKVKYAKLPIIGTLYFSNLTQDFIDFGQVINKLHFCRSDVFNKVLLLFVKCLRYP